jgi:DNA-binding response OmpR family regulator
MSSGVHVPTVLLIENNPSLRELEEYILVDAGLAVVTPPAEMSVVAYAAERHVGVMVIHMEPGNGGGLDLVDSLQAHPMTRTIPIVAIADQESLAARAQAGPNVNVGIVAPYDVRALQGAVHAALRRPPPAAALPPGVRPQPAALVVATTALVHQSRELVVRALESVRQAEPYRSRFDELSVGLVDELGTLLGAITAGLQRGLPPSEVFATPEVRRTIDSHVQLRQQQGLPVTSLLRESQALQQQLGLFLTSLEGTSGFTAEDGRILAHDIGEYFDALTQDFVARYRLGNGGHSVPGAPG